MKVSLWNGGSSTKGETRAIGQHFSVNKQTEKTLFSLPVELLWLIDHRICSLQLNQKSSCVSRLMNHVNTIYKTCWQKWVGMKQRILIF
jgi:hypothetical protein